LSQVDSVSVIDAERTGFVAGVFHAHHLSVVVAALGVTTLQPAAMSEGDGGETAEEEVKRGEDEGEDEGEGIGWGGKGVDREEGEWVKGEGREGKRGRRRGQRWGGAERRRMGAVRSSDTCMADSPHHTYISPSFTRKHLSLSPPNHCTPIRAYR
jgi:hypothetical protein